jgi:hypothetical protein
MISKEEQKILKDFLSMKIPNEYKKLDKIYAVSNQEFEGDMPDLMYIYEELFDYVHCLLDGYLIEKNCNFINVPSIVFNLDFIKIMSELGERFYSLQPYCNKLAEVYKILSKYCI